MPASVTDLVHPKNKKIKATLAEKADLITSHVSGKNSSQLYDISMPS